MPNQILVIRFSNQQGINPILNEALADHYRFGSNVYRMHMGGVISVLLTDDTFEQIVQVVKEAKCGEPVQVIDAVSTYEGQPKSEIIYPELEARQLSEAGIQSEIQRLMEKSRTESLSEDEAERLQRLLESDPR